MLNKLGLYLLMSDKEMSKRVSLPKFDIKEVKLEQIRLIKEGNYDSLVIIESVNLADLFKFKLNNVNLIWIDKKLFVYYKKEIGYNEIMKDLSVNEIHEKTYNIEDHISMINAKKFINYDKRVFKKELLNKKFVEEETNKKIILKDKQGEEIKNGYYVSKIALEYVGNMEEKAMHIRSLTGYERYVVNIKDTDMYTVYMSKFLHNLFINDKVWAVIDRDNADIEEQLNNLKMYDEKKCILWKDWRLFKNKELMSKRDMFIPLLIGTIISILIINPAMDSLDKMFFDYYYNERSIEKTDIELDIDKNNNWEATGKMKDNTPVIVQESLEKQLKDIETTLETKEKEEYSSSEGDVNSNSNSNSNEQIIIEGDDTDDIAAYLYFLNSGEMTIQDVNLDRKYKDEHGRIINKKITEMMCLGKNIEDMFEPLSEYFYRWGYSENFANIYLSNVFERRQPTIEAFVAHIHEFTAKDLELEKNAQDEENDIITNLIERHVIKNAITKEEMVKQIAIHLILKGHSNAYIKFLLNMLLHNMENEQKNL